MIKIKVKITADLNVKGIVNFNGNSPTSFKFNKREAGQTLNNHNHAKRNVEGIDFTSSNCLRHCIFSSGVNLESEDQDTQDHFAASHIGILRGYMFASKSGTIKKSSCVCVCDAYTEKEAIFTEVCNKAGERTSTSFFSKDNASERVQKLESVFDFDSASFISFTEQPFFCEPEVFQQNLEDNFQAKGSKLYKRDVNGLGLSLNKLGSSSEGILLSDDQISELFRVFINNLKSLFRATRGGRLEIDEESIRVHFMGREFKLEEFNLKDFKIHNWEEKELEKAVLVEEKVKKTKKEKTDEKSENSTEVSAV